MYYNIYYRFYKLVRKLGEQSMPRYKAMLAMSIFLSLNLISLFGVLNILTGKLMIVDNLWLVSAFAIGLSAVHAWFILGDKRFSAMMEKFEHESETECKKGQLWAIAYVIGTIMLLAVVIMYLNDHPVTTMGIQSNGL